MTQSLIGWLIFFILAGIATFSGWQIYRHSDFVYKRLDDIWDRARKAHTRGELQQLHDELSEFYHQHCHLRQYGDYARQVKNFIEGKSSVLPQ